MAGLHSKLPLFAFGLTLSSLVLVAVLKDELSGGESPRRTVPTPLSEVDLVGGWIGPVDLAAAGCELIFAPLHTDPKRQSYDAEQLAERLELESGAPFRLEVKAEGRPETSLLLAAARAGELSIRDDEGEVARPLALAAKATGGSSLPIRRVFAPQATLDPELGGRLIFWGRAPGRGAVVVGPDFTWKLSASSVSQNDLPLFVASIATDPRPSSH